MKVNIVFLNYFKRLNIALVACLAICFFIGRNEPPLLKRTSRYLYSVTTFKETPSIVKI